MKWFDLSVWITARWWHFEILKFICDLFVESATFFRSVCRMLWSAVVRISQYRIEWSAKRLIFIKLVMSFKYSNMRTGQRLGLGVRQR